jgi:tetratricopeptide (TPR) repeat protein
MEVFMRAFVKIGSLGAGRRRLLTARSAAVAILVGCLGVFSAHAQAGPSFQEGVAQYNSGKYAQAVSTLQVVKASYPNNAWVHYYLAMSEQAIGHIEQAKAEYQWVISSRDPKLAPQATVGLAQLSNARTTGSGGRSSSTTVAAVSSGGGGGQKLAMGKVKKVLEFWATW